MYILFVLVWYQGCFINRIPPYLIRKRLNKVLILYFYYCSFLVNQVINIFGHLFEDNSEYFASISTVHLTDSMSTLQFHLHKIQITIQDAWSIKYIMCLLIKTNSIRHIISIICLNYCMLFTRSFIEPMILMQNKDKRVYTASSK